MHALKKVLTDNGFDASTLQPWRETDGGVVFKMTTPGGDEAVELWHRLRELVSQTHYWPVLLGDDEDVVRHLDNFELSEKPVTALLATAAALSGREVLEARRRAMHEDASGFQSDDGHTEAMPLGQWPDDPQPSDGFHIPFDLQTNQPKPRLHLAFVPTERPWEVPAFLGIGGWNECPGPEEHCAVMKHWHGRFGAEVVGVTSDVIEMHVPRPPGDRDAAMALARDQYAYCIDIVEQGVETISNLAGLLLDGHAWYFWWD